MADGKPYRINLAFFKNLAKTHLKFKRLTVTDCMFKRI
jgi:hypothetical protein